MSRAKMIFQSGGMGLILAMGWAAAPAVAGPCTEEIAEVRKTLSQTPDLGAATTGALSGSAPGSVPETAPPAGAKADQEKTAGDAGMTQMNQASGQVATSAQDVRQQQKGQPTAAQGGDTASSDKMTMAKNELDRAVMLDQQGSADCTGALGEVRRMMEGG